MTFCRSGWDRDRHRDGFMELSSPGLHGDDGTECGPVPEDGPHQVVWYGLGLNTNPGPPRGAGLMTVMTVDGFN